MSVSFALDLARSMQPTVGPAQCSYPGLSAPMGALDAKRGLRLPLPEGALAVESRSLIDDAAGALELTFSHHSKMIGGDLVFAMGQYEPFVRIEGGALTVTVYQHRLRMQVAWRPPMRYQLQVNWDHRAGITVVLRPARGPAQQMERRCTWRAYRQNYVPLSFGGKVALSSSGASWTPTFHGWLRAVRVHRDPLSAPGPVVRVTSPRGSQAALPAHRDVRLLALDDPPIIDSPWRARSIPDRLDDLRRTRECAGLDELAAGCRSELELFTRLIHHVGQLWPHYYYCPWPAGEQRHIFWKPGHEMIPQIAAGDMGGMCGGFAHVMEELFWSMGFDARRVNVEAHSSFEAFSNQFNKWMICDADNHTGGCRPQYLVDERGVPQSAADLALRHEQLRTDPQALDGIRAAWCQADGSVQLVEPRRLWHYTHVSVGQQDPAALRDNAIDLAWCAPQDRPAFEERLGRKSVRLVDTAQELCWSCHRVRVKLSWREPGRSLQVDTEPMQVTFDDGIERSLDDGDWQRGRRSFVWKLRPGVNTLAVRARNALGATGHPWRMQLWRRP